MKKPYKIVSGASTPNRRELADWLAKDGQLLIPLVGNRPSGNGRVHPRPCGASYDSLAACAQWRGRSPRVRGGFQSGFAFRSIAGSSPPVRGSPRLRTRSGSRSGFIPCCRARGTDRV